MKKRQAKTGNARVPRLGLRSSKAAPASAVLDVPSPDAVVLAVPDVPVGVEDVVPGELEDEEIVPAEAELGIDVVKLPVVEPPGATPPDVGLADSELAELDLVAEGVELGDCPELADDAAELDAVELPDVDVANRSLSSTLVYTLSIIQSHHAVDIALCDPRALHDCRGRPCPSVGT